MTTEPQEWELENWEEPKPLPELTLQVSPTRRVKICPVVGVPMPTDIKNKKDFEYWLKRAWYSKREQSWDMLPLTRDEWFDKILDDWEMFYRRMDQDMTPRFKKQVKKLLKKGGLIMVIGGRPAAQGDGKSIGGLMFCDMLQREFGIDVKPHVLFEHSHMEIVIDPEDDGWLVLDIDEDLRSTGEGSGNILIEISNRWQTNRKAKLIIISIGIDPGHSHPAVNIHLIPAGINETFQTTRFGMFVNGRFKGWIRMQRLYRPEDIVKYGTESELAPLAEYKARAVAHSRKVMHRSLTAIPPEIERAHIDLVKDFLEQEKREAKEQGLIFKVPKIDVLITYAKQLGLPTKTTNYPRRICNTAIYELEKADPELRKRITETIDLSDLLEMEEFWADYQKIVYSRYPDDYPLADRDAWMVTYRQMGKKDREIQEEMKLTMRANSIGERIRKGVSEWKVLPNNTQLGTIAEKFIGSRIESMGGARVEYVRSLEESARKGTPDISDTGNTRNATWAVNVKCSFEHDFARVFETSPEHETMSSWAVFVFPLLGKLSINEITGENSHFDTGRMVLCGIEEGIQKIQELIEG